MVPYFRVGLLIAVACSGVFAEETPTEPAKRRFFEQRIRPVLVKRCYQCHSAEAKVVKGGLRVDFKAGLLKGGDSGAAIVPGKPDASLLMQALAYGDLKMPPDGQLDGKEIAAFRKWIRDGAFDPRADAGKPISPAGPSPSQVGRDHWAFQPLSRPTVPTAGEGWARNAIDRFVAARRQKREVLPVDQAAPHALLRRLHLGVTGLPPLPGEVMHVTSDFTDAAYEAAVDRLLDSPHYGPHWARMWLDVARFAESSGFEMDHDRPEAWRYREFVIRAFNDDMPYDAFIQRQIAGDHLWPDDTDAITATGFVVGGVENLIQSRKEYVRDRYDKIDDMVNTVSTGLLGLTVGCARCHDHKYDPISQRDYYHVAAAFASTISRVRELPQGEGTIRAFVAGEAPDHRIRMVTVTEPGAEGFPSIPAVVHFLPRGNSAAPQQAMEPGFPGVLLGDREPSQWTADVPGRVALARWITDADEGAGQLLARVMVNRLWLQHFGHGIVGTPSDFGIRGDRPTHPELLDWLASELIRQKWRLKPIHKLMLMSATYRLGYGRGQETMIAENMATDPGNQLLWRREPKRLRAEAIRDQLLAVSGRIELTGLGLGAMNQEDPHRSIYLRVKRSRMTPVLQLFDAPDALQGVGERQTTTTAPQGLMLLNNPFVIACADTFAQRLANEQPADTAAMIQRGFLYAVGRPPTAAEQELCKTLLEPGTPAAARDFCQMLFCLNEFIYVE